MVRAIVKKEKNSLKIIEISGHANAGDFGSDLVCAGITAIVGGALNAFDQQYKNKVKLVVLENKITIEVLKNSDELQNLLNFMFIQLQTISAQYPKNFKIEEVL